jgi:hypothetical protein
MKRIIFIVLLLVIYCYPMFSVLPRLVPGVSSGIFISSSGSGDTVFIVDDIIPSSRIAKIINPYSGELIKFINLSQLRKSNYLSVSNSHFLSNDGRLIYIIIFNRTDSVLYLLSIDVEKGTLSDSTSLCSPEHLFSGKYPPSRIGISPNKQYFYYFYEDTIFAVFDILNKKYVQYYYKNVPHWGTGVSFTADSRHLVFPLEKSVKIMDFLKDSVILEVPTGNNHIHTTILITPDLSKVLRWYGVDGNFNIIDSKSGEVLYVYPNWTPQYFGSYAFSPDSKRFYMNATSNYFAKVTLDTFSVKTKVADTNETYLEYVFNFNFVYNTKNGEEYLVPLPQSPLELPSVIPLFDPNSMKVRKIISPFVFRFEVTLSQWFKSRFFPLRSNLFVAGNYVYEYKNGEFNFVTKIPAVDFKFAFDRFYLVFSDSMWKVIDIFGNFVHKSFVINDNTLTGSSIEKITDALEFALLKKSSKTSTSFYLYDIANSKIKKQWNFNTTKPVFQLSRFGNYAFYIDSLSQLVIENINQDKIIYSKQIQNDSLLVTSFSFDESHFYYGFKGKPFVVIKLAPEPEVISLDNFVCTNPLVFISNDNLYMTGYSDSAQTHFVVYDINNKRIIDEYQETIDVSKKVFGLLFPAGNIFVSATELYNFYFYDLSNYISKVKDDNNISNITPLTVKFENDKLFLISNREFNSANIVVFNLLGEPVQSWKSTNIAIGVNELSFDRKLPSGVYFLILFDKTTAHNTKFIIN